MFYVIKKGTQYFNSGLSGWVNSSGLCSTPTWGTLDQAYGTSSKAGAQLIADRYGGEVVVYS